MDMQPISHTKNLRFSTFKSKTGKIKDNFLKYICLETQIKDYSETIFVF